MAKRAQTTPAAGSDAFFQQTIRQMLADWQDATPEQRAEALRLAAISAERAAQ